LLKNKSTIIVTNRNNDYFICSVDEYNPFVAQLPRKPKDIKHAYNMLRPQTVRVADNKGKKVKRQGDWFFVPTRLNDKELANKLRIKKKTVEEKTIHGMLPFFDKCSNKHCAKFLVTKRAVYAKGTVKHWNSAEDEQTGLHDKLKLGNNWHLVCHCSALATW
jgi:hypothetical protein